MHGSSPVLTCISIEVAFHHVRFAMALSSRPLAPAPRHERLSRHCHRVFLSTFAIAATATAMSAFTASTPVHPSAISV